MFLFLQAGKHMGKNVTIFMIGRAGKGNSVIPTGMAASKSQRMQSN